MFPTSRALARAVVGFATLTLSAATAKAQRDVVLIVTDDQTYDEMQFMPQTNAIIGNLGVRFSRAFVSTPTCCPSRSTLLTGLYEHNHGVFGNAAPEGGATRFADGSTLATWLSQAGYRTAIFGKYLNEYFLLEPWPYVPPGWSDWHAFVEASYIDFQIVENGGVTSFSGQAPANYSTTVVTRKAVRFIESVPAGERLFLYFTPFAPHSPAQPAAQDAGDFAGLAPWRPAAWNEADVTDKPRWIRRLPLLGAAEQDSLNALRRRRVESLQSVDRAVAEIAAALKSAGRLDDAVLVFTSDNGFSLGEHRWTLKNCVYEPCVHVPLLVRAPGVSPRIEGRLVLNTDLAPSIADWAGITPPAPVNGSSLAPLLADPNVPWRDAVLLETLSGQGAVPQFQAVRTTRYVYVEYETGERELYDLKTDPQELANRAGDPDLAGVESRLRGKLSKLRNDSAGQISRAGSTAHPALPLGARGPDSD